MELNYEELVASYRQDLELETKDDVLVQAINTAMDESKEIKEKIDKLVDENKAYWKFGSAQDDGNLHPNKSKVKNNRIFTDMETAIPIITSATPEISVIGEITNDIKEKIKKGFTYAYEVKFAFQKVLQQLVRSWYIQHLGILSYWWDEKKGFCVTVELAKKMGFDRYATCLADAEYCWQIMETTQEELIAKYNAKKDDILKVSGTENPRAKIRYVKFWGGNGAWYAIKLNNLILKKGKNPNYDYESEDNNIFERPQFPFLLFNVFNLSDDLSVYDDTGLIQQTKTLQEDANKGKRQISELNEGQKRVWTLSGIEEKIAQKLVNETGDIVIQLKNGSVKEQVGQVQAGKPDAAMFNNVQSSLTEIDNIMGIHSTTRGERQEQETLGGRKLLRGADIGRLDLIVRNLEQIIEEWFTAYLQMLKVYSENGEIIRTENDKVELKPEDIPAEIKIMIKKGSTLPADEENRAETAGQLAQSGMVDPATLFEELGYSNVEKRVQDLYRWLALTGKIDPAAVQMTQGVSTNPDGDKISQRINEIISSPNFQKLSPEEQKQYLPQFKEILNKFKQ